MSSGKQTQGGSHTPGYNKDVMTSIIDEANSKIQCLKTTISQYNTQIKESRNPQEQETLRKKRDSAYEKIEKVSSKAKSSIASLTKASNSHHSIPNNMPSKDALTTAHDITHQLKHEEEHKASSKNSKTCKTNTDRAAQVELAFVMDATRSMTPYINETKEKINEIIRTAKALYPHGRFRIAIIVYRDFEQGDDNTIVLQFTDSVTEVENFLTGISAVGNLDEPEDVNGAFRKAIDVLKWTSYTRILIHIGDSPCHGSQFHDQSLPDHYTQYKGLDRNWNEIFYALKRKGIDYHFLRLGTRTDIMINEFKKIWDSCNVVSGSRVCEGRNSALYVHDMSTSARDLVGKIVGSIRKSVGASEAHLTNLTSRQLADKFLLNAGSNRNDIIKALSK